MKRQRTSTYTFGSSSRNSHDAQLYYARSLFRADLDSDVSLEEVPDEALGVRCADARDLSWVPNNSVALMVTSPPYHVGKQYDTDDDFDSYLKMLGQAFTEVYRVLEPGGRAVINVAGLGRKPYVPLPDLVGQIMRDIGFLMRGEIIWVKGKGMNGSAAFGSFCKASNPVLRDVHEYLLAFSKGRWGRVRKGTSTIAKEDFLAWTLSVWNVAPESARRIGHPAPFPVEIPRRFIELYTFENDVVLDPFGGAGTTALAAALAGRKYICIDNHAPYVDIALRRLAAVETGPEGFTA